MLSAKKKIYGTTEKPRVCVFRSNKYISAQVIDDQKGITLCAKSSKTITAKVKPIEKSLETGKALGVALKAKKITSIVFDRSCYRYHGQVKALADGLREAGIKF